MIFTVIAFVVALGILVAIHEYGHYWVARRCGVHVERFSLGFGPVLWRRTDKHGCEWAVSALPLGGYVMMQQDPTPDSPPQAAATAFNQKSLAQRAAITAAGPIANLLLAVVLYTVIGLVGVNEPRAILASPPAGSVAAKAGLQGGEQVVAVNHKAIQSWPQFHWELLDLSTAGGEVHLQVQANERAGLRALQFQLPPAELHPDGPDPMGAAGFALQVPNVLAQEVLPGSAAERGGVQAEDQIIAIDDIQQPNAREFVNYVQTHPGKEVTLTVVRNGEPQALTLTIDRHTNAAGESIGRVGLQLQADYPTTTVRYGLIGSLTNAVIRTSDTFTVSLKMMARMVTGQVSVKNISGPVSIADYAGKTARFGLIAYLQFLALISVSIALLNLLPIPMLDGGHLLYYAVEAIRGKPLSETWQMRGRTIGLFILGALMLLAFTNDFLRIIG
ncbi:MAG TPA: RIP metalloprotease RseP [Candidatus Paenalcaligenes intestinipullorum]|uniref:Zinc metalloprotease n=1 Tax=Candidatus Paenalcaligenes intestinipullorum TaxID=2838718 RepID=A0A9D2RFD9_9BURK|nr:RIP metalloprotease RseP [Candidatus Paenalcaligenes intestinipullorum]